MMAEDEGEEGGFAGAWRKFRQHGSESQYHGESHHLPLGDAISRQVGSSMTLCSVPTDFS